MTCNMVKVSITVNLSNKIMYLLSFELTKTEVSVQVSAIMTDSTGVRTAALLTSFHKTHCNKNNTRKCKLKLETPSRKMWRTYEDLT